MSTGGGTYSFRLLRYCGKKILRLWPVYAASVLIVFVIREITTVPNFETLSLKDLLLNLTYINGFWGTAYVEPAHWYMTTLLRALLIVGILHKLRVQNKVIVYDLWLTLIIALKVIQRIAGDSVISTVCLVLLKFTGGSYVGVFVLAFMMRRLSVCNSLKDMLSKEYRMELLTAIYAMVFLIALPGVVYLFMVLCAGCVFWLASKEKLKFLNNRVFLFFGKISFSFYLIHQYVCYCVQWYGTQYLRLPYAAATVAAFGVSLLLALLLYAFVEKPTGKRLRKS